MVPIFCNILILKVYQDLVKGIWGHDSPKIVRISDKPPHIFYHL